MRSDERDPSWARVLMLGLGISAGAWSCGHQAGTSSADQPSASSAQRALAPADLLRVAEVDPELLDKDRQQRLLQLAESQPCPCAGDRQQLGACALAGKACVRARFALRSIARALHDGAEDTELRERLVERFGPREPERIDLVGAPCRGPAAAPVTMVVFSDFECPHCALAARLSDQLLRESGDRLRVCFKHYPLSSIHQQARLAARAAVAAGRQGKFWQMHDTLYAEQEALDREGLLERARELELEAERFVQDLDSPKADQVIERDLAEARRLGLQGTPTFFINGREMTDPKTRDIFLDWIAEALAVQQEAVR